MSGLTPKTAYKFRVRAKRGGTLSKWSNIASATTKPGSAPDDLPAPSRLKAKAVSSGQINLKWRDNATDETGFEIERRSAGKPWQAAGSVAANTTRLKVSGLTPKTAYKFRVRAKRGGTLSKWSNIAKARTQTR